MSAEVFDALSAEQKGRLAFDLANFLWEIHGALTPDEARKIGIVEEDLLSYGDFIRPVLSNKINDGSILRFMETRGV